jgi:hypothetical protein
MLQHGTTYVIYALYIHRIINFKTNMEFVYDGKHGVYHLTLFEALWILQPLLLLRVLQL